MVTINITEVMLNQTRDPCGYVRDFNEQLSSRFKFAFFTVVGIQILQLLIMERYLKRYKKGEIKSVDQFYIAHTFMAIAQYLQAVFILFMIFASTGLFNI